MFTSRCLPVLLFNAIWHVSHAFPLTISGSSAVVEGTLSEGSTVIRSLSTSSVIWSCLATLLLSFVVCIHPNIPSPKEKLPSRILAQLHIAFWVMVAPEWTLYWAIMQWRSAGWLAKKYAGQSAAFMRRNVVVTFALKK